MLRRVLGWVLTAIAAIGIIVAGMHAASEPPAPPAHSIHPQPTNSGQHPPRFCRDTDRKNIPYGDRDYAPWLDGDQDGLACEIPPVGGRR